MQVILQDYLSRKNGKVMDLSLCSRQVDRSGAYIVRQVAKSIVASGLARRVIVQVPLVLLCADVQPAAQCSAHVHVHRGVAFGMTRCTSAVSMPDCGGCTTGRRCHMPSALRSRCLCTWTPTRLARSPTRRS